MAAPSHYRDRILTTETEQAPKKAGKGKGIPWIMLVLGGAVFVALIMLGNWQVRRLAWKENLLATIDQRIHDDPMPIGVLVDDRRPEGKIEYTPVKATGRFDYAGTSYFFATHMGQSGWYVYTPLTITDGTAAGNSVLVNRGFVPYDMRDPLTWPGTQADGVVAIEGLARERLDTQPGMAPDNKPSDRTFYWKDWAAMARVAGLDEKSTLPFFIDAGFPDRNYPVDVLPQPGVTLINLPNNHLQYAITWYGLAVTLVVVMGAALWRRRRGNGEDG